MPIFSRRRIQRMLDDLAGKVRPAHFIGRLNDKRYENALPAEAELGLVWAVDRLGGFESEPTWYSPDGRRPEGVSSQIFPGRDAAFDVKAVSDRAIPGVVGMRRLSAKRRRGDARTGDVAAWHVAPLQPRLVDGERDIRRGR